MNQDNHERNKNSSPDLSPPGRITANPHEFWRVGLDLAEFTIPTAPIKEPILEHLGPPPFPKTGFPFIGFLATVYDHVASHTPNCDSH